jgi:hypothetical protein
MEGSTRIESLPGLAYEAVEDIEYLKNKMLQHFVFQKHFLDMKNHLEVKQHLQQKM